MIPLGGGGDSKFTYSMLLFAISVTLLLSLFIPIFCPKMMPSDNENEVLRNLEDQYTDFVGSKPASESIWALTGIYTPYGVGYDGNPTIAWGRTDDGWLYGERVATYIPSQYDTTDERNAYKVQYNDASKLYYYTDDSNTINKHNAGDLYSSVVMSKAYQSNMFFSSSGKVTQGSDFYYKYSGLRYSFSPVTPFTTIDADGNKKDVVPNTSSLSLIWYNYYGDEGGPGTTGIAGQLIITGSDSGVAYLTAAQIVSAFNTDTSTSKFVMSFNGVDMNVYIRLDPVKLSSGFTVEECYNQGYWSIMVSSRSIDTSAYASADYEFSPTAIFETMIDLFTFNMSDYGLTDVAATLASLLILIPLFIGLISIGMSNYPVIIFAGIWGVLTAWSHGLFD